MTGSIHDAIVREVTSWPGVTTARHRFGGTEFRLGRRELGHLHGNRLADLPFPLLVRDELVNARRAEPHHIFPESGWVSCFIHGEHDVANVIALFRLNYDRPWVKSPSSTVKGCSASASLPRRQIKALMDVLAIDQVLKPTDA